MSLQLQRVQVHKLFGIYDLDVPITDNVIVLVGENGSGKSTLISMIYYSLTAQWYRLCDLPFGSLSLTINDKRFVVDRESLQQCLGPESDQVRLPWSRMPPRVADRILRDLDERIPEYWLTHRRELRRVLGPVPSSTERAVVLLLEQRESDSSAAMPPDVIKLGKLISEQFDDQVLFLPTYRRIEKEIGFLFPELDLEESLVRRRPARKRDYIELIEFGMKDVENLVRLTLEKLDQSFRNELNRLTGSYLRDVIQEEHKRVHVTDLASPEVAHTVDSMLSRMEDDVLSEEDRAKLRELLESIQQGHDLEPEQKILAHFLSRLVSIHKKQKEREMPVRNFTEVTSKYLSGKEFSFDPVAFKLDVRRTSPTGSKGERGSLSLQGLSSGEKQIVSLFSHIYLGGMEKSYFVLIDEPELSISVEWQRNFLEDIRQSGQCSGLIAVTHSPFIFDNSLADSAHSMHEFTKPAPRSESAA